MAKAEWDSTTAIIAQAVAILKSEWPTTIRQLFYRLVSVGILKNDRGSYQKVSRMMTTARKDGRCSYEYITDRSRPEYTPNVWRDAVGYAEAVKKSYRKDYWATRPNHVEVWTEKDAIIGCIQPLTDELGISVRVGRGCSSTTKKHEISRLFQKIPKQIFVLYLGDHDPSGVAIEENLRESIDAGFEMERLAIHHSDIREFSLPPLRVKETDSRSEGFVTYHGSECVELDALPPNELRARIENAVIDLRDSVLWDRAIAVERIEMASIVATVERWSRSPGLNDV